MSGTPAGIAQLVEQLICNQQVGGSSPSTGSTQKGKLHMGEFPSGQRGQTVNLLLIASVVRIHLPPPAKDPPAVLVGFYWWGKIRGFEPTQIQHAGGMLAKPVQTLVFSLPLSLGKRAFESTFPPHCATSIAGGFLLVGEE